MFPKLFEFGPLTVHTYGFLLAVAFLAGLAMASWRARKEGIEGNKVWDLGVLMILSGLVGAKFILIVTEWDYYSANPADLFSLATLRAAGVWYGGLLAALAATAVYLWRSGLPAWKVADIFAPSVALGHAIGRLGCFFAGCDYGRPTARPWGVTFTSDYANETVGVPLNVPIHPTQLYESGAEALILVILLVWYPRKKFDGQIVCLYLLLYGCVRFFIEFLRGDSERGFVFGSSLSTSQFVSLLVVPAALFFWWRRARMAAA